MNKIHHYNPQTRPHPGETLTEKLEEMCMGPKEFALRTGKPEKTVIAIMNGKSSITPEMAVKFENVTKIPAHFWMNHQRSYDEFIVREKQKVVIKEGEKWTKHFPLSEMMDKGWIQNDKPIQEKTMQLLSFFGFTHHTAWEHYYLNQKLKVAFSISLSEVKDPYSLSTWLRKGDLDSMELISNEYSEKKVKEILPKIKELMNTHPKNLFDALQHICLEAGVKIVHTPSLSKMKITASTRWVQNSPLIQLTDRYDRNDIFWWTFFHQLGHVILHGKKDIFLENVEYQDKDEIKEQEADEFARKWLLTHAQEQEIVTTSFSDKNIMALAKKYDTNPAIIVGKLIGRKAIPIWSKKKYFKEIVF